MDPNDVQTMAAAANIAAKTYSATSKYPPPDAASMPQQPMPPPPTGITFDKTFPRTQAGLIKIGTMIADLIGMFCVFLSQFSNSSQSNFFNFIASTGLIVTCILFLIYAFHFNERFTMIPWARIELGFSAIWTIFYIIASIILAANAASDDAWAAASFFGFVASLFYGFEAVKEFRHYRTGHTALNTSTSY